MVRQSGLRIDMQAVLFDEGLADKRDLILAALHDPGVFQQTEAQPNFKNAS